MLISLTLLLILLNFHHLVSTNVTTTSAPTQTTASVENTCGEWESFKNEKCFKLFPNIDTYDNAKHLCRAQSSYATLASVRSKEEQDFLQNYVFDKHNSVDSVWIGGNKNNSNQKFQWEDGSEFSFANWDDSRFDKTGNDCIEMQPEIGYANTDRLGKWTQVSCEKRNGVLCQFIQEWTTSRIETVFLDFKTRVEATIEKMNEQIKELTKNAASIPIGFIYFQLPAQQEPKEIWQSFQWEDVSKSYAGLFFRVLGGNSSSFGSVQESDSPQLTDISEYQTNGYTTQSSILPQHMNTKQLSLCFYSCNNNYHNILFKFSNASTEVRPRNQAILVWKRVK